METKRYPLRVVLAVVTGRLLTKGKSGDNGIGDLYEILGWMTDDEPFTHQLGRFTDECKPWLLRWFPALGVAIEDLHILDKALSSAERGNGDLEDGISVYLGWLRGDRELMPFYDIPRIPKDDHTRRDAVDELKEMHGTEKNIIAINPPSRKCWDE